VARSLSPERLGKSDGFTLVEVLVCMLVLATGLVGMAGLLGVTTRMHLEAREATRATRLAEDKVDQLMKLIFTTAPSIQVNADPTTSLTSNVANYFDQPVEGITRRWNVQPGPTANTRVLTVRIINNRTRQFGSQTDLSTVIMQW